MCVKILIVSRVTTCEYHVSSQPSPKFTVTRNDSHVRLSNETVVSNTVILILKLSTLQKIIKSNRYHMKFPVYIARLFAFLSKIFNNTGKMENYGKSK